jgi:carbon-monoxide dehydrogenase large subunit/6-hydroxypseudooxynicotine dehydrogenase subunit gamma
LTRSLIGARVRRKEDPRLVRGRGRYVADIEPPGTLHAAVVRSPHAHARIRSIDAAAARARPGVHTVMLPDEVAGVPGIPVRVHPRPELIPFLQQPLAQGKVRFVGDPVAVVVAETRYLAEDAAELVEVDYEPLPAVVDGRESVDRNAALLFEEQGTNVCAVFGEDVGDVDGAFAAAHVVVGDLFEVQRHGALPMEPRGLVASYDEASGRLTVWGPTKVPHANRATLSELIGFPEERIRFIEPEVGGGFGARGEVYPEDILIPLLALRLGRPVKWIEDRREALLTTNHSREGWYEIELALAADGTFLGLRGTLVNVMGGYLRTHGIRVPEIAARIFPGPYRIANYRCDVECVLTNKTPVGTYRAPGRFETNFVRERLIDMAAKELGIDGIELRRRNFVRHEDTPYEAGTFDMGEPVVYRDVHPPSTLDRALELVGYDDVCRRRDALRAEGRRIGIGIGCYMEESGLGGVGLTPGEYARLEVGTGGALTLYSGVAALGQGLETALAQVVASELGVGIDDVTVVHGDTDRVPWGGGTWADRGAIIACSAALLASGEVKAKLASLGARLLEANVDDVEVAEGLVRAKDDPTRSVTWSQVVRATYTKALTNEGVESGIDARTVFHVPEHTYAPGTQIAVVEVDEETGVVTVLDYATAQDVGRAINPPIVEGQIVGGVVQGIGGALLEHFAYDENGQPLASTLMDYLLPSSTEAPATQHAAAVEDLPSPLNPLGTKGVGDVGPAGAGAAVANAVADALSDLEVRVTALPLSPDRVRALVRDAALEAAS